jgi:hypothetical protein
MSMGRGLDQFGGTNDFPDFFLERFSLTNGASFRLGGSTIEEAHVPGAVILPRFLHAGPVGAVPNKNFQV